MALHFPTDAERPDFRGAMKGPAVWPEFLYHDAVVNEHFMTAIRAVTELQFYVWDDESDEVIGQGNAVPATWSGEAGDLPDEGLRAVLAEQPPEPNVLCALQIMIAPDRRGEGLSGRMIQRMHELGREHGFERLIAPVRPNLKHRYPLAPMERYVEWRRPDGALLDPWLRTHEALGARILKVAPQSMRVAGSVPEWEEWTGLSFPESGAYVVEGALVPVEIDRERDEGLYVEPNVWMVHG